MDSDDLPDEIVQPLLQLGRALMSHARAHRDTSLAEHEDGVLAAWRMVAPVPGVIGRESGRLRLKVGQRSGSAALVDATVLPATRPGATRSRLRLMP